MLSVSKLSIGFRTNLFHDLSFSLGNGEKVGLIGLNGCGKSTLLKIIAGLEEQDGGKVDHGGEVVAYLPQEYDFAAYHSIQDFLNAKAGVEHYKINRVLGKMNLHDLDPAGDVNLLSYGQKMKLYLAGLMLTEPTVLLLDEPTNHLDLDGINWLEDFLKTFTGISMIVSHDRAFLNNVTDHIFEIDEQKLHIYTGNYDDFVNEKQKRLGQRAEQYRQQERLRSKLENMIVLIRKQSSGLKQSKKLKSAKTRLNREVVKKEISQYREQRIQGLDLGGQNHATRTVIKVKDLTFGFDRHSPLLESAEFTLYGREKVWLYGENGIGKSTLVKLLVGELEPNSGVAQIGHYIDWAYFSQDQSHLPYDQTVAEYFMHKTGTDFQRSFSLMEKFLFGRELRDVTIAKLSPGQRARLSFTVFAQKHYDLLILDEPTNHLDIRSKEVIEAALRDYQGAMLLISHDRYFIEQVGIDRAVTISDGKLVELKQA
jgi:ATPase subunit of ABC transporter with duplicated ATPase domains